ncbi:MAG: RNA polymerase sigma factor [Gaiellales bacterium]
MSEHPNDAQLLESAEQDPQAFGHLYDRYAARLYVYAAGHVGSADVATELVAETFAQAWRSRRRARADDEGSLAPWLYGIARNLLRHYHRRRSVESRARKRLHIAVGAAELDDSLADRLAAEDARPDLRAAIAQLPADQRRAVGLRVLAELPYEEIARRLDCTTDTARARVSRGLRGLNTSLEGARK